MDAKRFDALTQSLSSSRTRRGAFGALLAGALGLLSLPLPAAGRKPHHQHDARKRRNAAAEGPCGDGSGKANACKRDKDCCTGFCDQAKGRCRCKKLGQGCDEDRNCCAKADQPISCLSGTCQRALACTPEGAVCGASGCTGASRISPATCNAAGECQAPPPVPCDDGNPCTSNSCLNGVCQHAPLPDLTVCAGQTIGDFSFCQAGQCVRCHTAGEICTSVQECCGWNANVAGGLGTPECAPHPIATTLRFCCISAFGACRFSGECCSGFCFQRPEGGFCTFLE